MTWVDQTLEEFGQSMGIPGLQFNDGGVVSLTIESMGDLFLERLPDDEVVLVYLVRRLDHPNAQHYASALELTHWTRNNPMTINASLRGDDRLVFSVRIPDSDFSLPTMDRVVSALEQLHDQVREGATT